MGVPDIPSEIWYLIFKALPTQEDLNNVCRVCKSFDTLATPLLYRSVIFRKAMVDINDWSRFPGDDVKSPEVAADLSFGLFYRLLDDRNQVLRAFVREITFEVSKSYSELKQKLEQPQDLLAVLVKALPNLEAVYFEGELPITKAFVDALLNHTKSPKLFLLGEEGHTEMHDRMPFVPELKIDVDATATAPRESQQIAQPWTRDFKPQILDLQKIFASYSNLERLSVSVNILRGGCVIDLSTPSTRIIPLSDGVTFPPLKHLSLNGFSIMPEELSLWKDRFPWDKLESLSLGVQETPRVLETAIGNVQNLKEFQITSYTRYNVSRSTPALEDFLSSFHSLESLTAKGLVPTLETVMQHPKLKHLCLHAIEETDAERQILSIKEIEDLGQYCIHLTSLELDMNPNGAWDNDLIKAIATNFENLQQLSIHVGLGIADSINKAKDGFPIRKAFESVLTEETARSFGKQFFECSKQSSLKKITLKSGEDLRWFPQWPPGYASAEEESAKTFEIYPPSEQSHEPRLIEVANDYYPLLNWWRRGSRLRKAHGANDEGNGALQYRRRSAPRILQPSDFAA